MSRPTRAIINHSHLIHNLHIIKQSTPAKIMAMVKANAYGHGIVNIAKILDLHVDSIGVASIDEALELRESGIQGDITLIEGVFTPKDLTLAAKNDLTVIFHSATQVEWVNNIELSNPLRGWLKVNTGMCRLGFPKNEALSQLDTLSKSKNIISPVGIMSHFACADEKDHPKNQEQIGNFQNIIANHNGPKSICNSAAIFNFPKHHYDLVRPGLALYGASPLVNVTPDMLNLKPVMTLQTELIAIHNLKAGDAVGYGSTYQCTHPMKVGVVAIGYGDGYPRNAKTGTPTLINGKRCPIVGRVSMDMLTVDLSNSPTSKIGDTVTLWGEGLPVEEIAPYTGHISYDLLTLLQQRVKYRFITD